LQDASPVKTVLPYSPFANLSDGVHGTHYVILVSTSSFGPHCSRHFPLIFAWNQDRHLKRVDTDQRWVATTEIQWSSFGLGSRLTIFVA